MAAMGGGTDRKMAVMEGQFQSRPLLPRWKQQKVLLENPAALPAGVFLIKIDSLLWGRTKWVSRNTLADSMVPLGEIL